MIAGTACGGHLLVMSPDPNLPKEIGHGTRGARCRARFSSLRQTTSDQPKAAGGAVLPVGLEGQEDIQDLVAVAWLLDVGDLAAAAIPNPRFGDLLALDGVV